MNSFLNLLEQNLFTCIPSISKPTNLEEENLSESELLVNFDGKNFNVENSNPSQDKIRINSFLRFLSDVREFLPDHLSCKFILNLYEGIYDEKNNQRLAYTAKPNSNHILIPDSHNFETINKIKSLQQVDIPFEQKEKKAIFIGSDTGNRRKDGWTMRSIVSNHYANSPDIFSKIFSIGDSINRFERTTIDAVTFHPLDLNRQLKHQIVLNINGNSTSWERLLWAMASNSLCVFVKPFDGEEMYSWYYPMLEALGLAVYVEYDKLDSFIKQNDFNNTYWRLKNEQQKQFAYYVASLHTQGKLVGEIFKRYNEIFNS
jgi:hypothetical protein